MTPKTDGDGRATVELVPAGPLVLTVTPKHLQDQKAQWAFFEANPGNPDAWKLAMIRLGRVRVKAANTPTEIEVKMPEGSGY